MGITIIHTHRNYKDVFLYAQEISRGVKYTNPADFICAPPIIPTKTKASFRS